MVLTASTQDRDGAKPALLETYLRTWAKAGLAVADVDVKDELATARRVLLHLEERRPETYR